MAKKKKWKGMTDKEKCKTFGHAYKYYLWTYSYKCDRCGKVVDEREAKADGTSI